MRPHQKLGMRTPIEVEDEFRKRNSVSISGTENPA